MVSIRYDLKVPDQEVFQAMSPLRKGIWPGHALHTFQAVDHTRRIQTPGFWVVHRDYDYLSEQCDQ